MTKEEFIESIRLEGEVWVDYPDCNDYVASSLGRIITTKRNKVQLLKQVKYVERNKEYYSVCLFIDGRQAKTRVHKIIARTFLEPSPGDGYEIDHINGDGLDNRVCNLRWCTHAENMANPTTKKRLKSAHKEMRPWYKRIPGTNPKIKRPVVQLEHGEIVKVYDGIVDTGLDGFTPQNVLSVCRGKAKTHHGYQWAYLDEYNSVISSSNFLE